MKKLIIASVLGFGLISSAWAAETVNVHEHVKNAQAPAHQLHSAVTPSAVKGGPKNMMNMDQHERAAVAHETMKNGQASAHQSQAEQHRLMSKAS